MSFAALSAYIKAHIAKTEPFTFLLGDKEHPGTLYHTRLVSRPKKEQDAPSDGASG